MSGFLGLSGKDQAFAALAAAVNLAWDAQIPEKQVHTWIKEAFAARDDKSAKRRRH